VSLEGDRGRAARLEVRCGDKCPLVRVARREEWQIPGAVVADKELASLVAAWPALPEPKPIRWAMLVLILAAGT
jgi:hypothetical protein